MKTSRIFRRWQRHYSKLFDQQWTLLRETREEGSPEHVHELRIALRRLRLMLRIAGPLLDEPAIRRYRSWSRGILAGTSRLRDYDAALEWLGTRNADAGAVRWIERQRHRLWRIARVRMTEPPSKTWSRLSRFKLNHREKLRFEKRFCKQFNRLEESVRSQLPEIPGLDPEQRHEVRRKLRRIRYLREIVLPHRKRVADHLLKRIIRLQTAMGDLQNLTNARQILSRVPAQGVTPSLQTLLSKDEAVRKKEILRFSHALQRSRDGEPTSPSRRPATIPRTPSLRPEADP